MPKQQATFRAQNVTAAGAAIAYVSSATAVTLSSTQASIAITGYTATAGNNLVIYVSNFSSAVSAVSVTDPSSNTYTVVANYANAGTGANNNQVIICAHGVTGFTGTVTVTATGLDFPSMGIDQFSGTMSCTLDNSTSPTCLVQNSTATTPTGTYTTLNAADLLYATFYADNSGATWSALTSGWTFRTTNLGYMTTATRIVSTTQASQTIAATGSAGDTSVCMVALH